MGAVVHVDEAEGEDRDVLSFAETYPFFEELVQAVHPF